MATTIYLTNTADTKDDGVTDEQLVAQIGSPGSGLSTGTANTTASGTSITLTRSAGGDFLVWYTPPLNAVSIGATSITMNFWMSESNMSANVSARVVIELWRQVSPPAWTFISTILNNNRAVELPVTTRAAQNWSATATSTTVQAGDAIAIYMVGGNAGTMASGFTFNGGFGGATGGADGDSFVTFTETITEQTVAATSLMLPNRNLPVFRR